MNVVDVLDTEIVDVIDINKYMFSLPIWKISSILYVEPNARCSNNHFICYQRSRVVFVHWISVCIYFSGLLSYCSDPRKYVRSIFIHFIF